MGGNRHGRARGLDHLAPGEGSGGEDWWWGAAEPGGGVHGGEQFDRRKRGFACGFVSFFCFFSLFPLSTFFPLDEMGERKGLGEVEYEVKRGLAPALERKNKINGVILIGWPLGDGGGRDKPSPSTSSDGFGIGCRFAFALLCLVGRFG